MQSRISQRIQKILSFPLVIKKLMWTIFTGWKLITFISPTWHEHKYPYLYNSTSIDDITMTSSGVVFRLKKAPPEPQNNILELFPQCGYFLILASLGKRCSEGEGGNFRDLAQLPKSDQSSDTSSTPSLEFSADNSATSQHSLHVRPTFLPYTF